MVTHVTETRVPAEPTVAPLAEMRAGGKDARVDQAARAIARCFAPIRTWR
jgi:hypothetical protein